MLYRSKDEDTVESECIDNVSETCDRSSVPVVEDKDVGDTAHHCGGWFKCASSAEAAKRDYQWLAIDLKEVFLITAVRATFRYESGQTRQSLSAITYPSLTVEMTISVETDGSLT